MQYRRLGRLFLHDLSMSFTRGKTDDGAGDGQQTEDAFERLPAVERPGTSLNTEEQRTAGRNPDDEEKVLESDQRDVLRRNLPGRDQARYCREKLRRVVRWARRNG